VWGGTPSNARRGLAVLIALLAVLGVDLITIVALIALVIVRRRWLKRQPGEFVAAVRVSRGEIDGLSRKWKRGSGRWVRDVFVWSKGSLRLRNGLVPVDRLSRQRQAKAGEVRRLGDSPVVCEFESNGATMEIAGKADQAALVAGPSLPTPHQARVRQLRYQAHERDRSPERCRQHASEERA
jgi:Protein of unknown function (DUF2550)